jgi:hypothetical protein
MVMPDAGLLLARGGETVSQQVAGHEPPAADDVVVSTVQTICERRRALVASASETLIGIAVDVMAERRRSGETPAETVDAVRAEVRRICTAIEHRVIENVLSIADDDEAVMQRAHRAAQEARTVSENSTHKTVQPTYNPGHASGRAASPLTRRP